MVKFVNSTLLKRASYRLMLMEKHYELPRYARIIGRSKEVIVNFLRGVDINSNYDVQLEMGVSLNQSTTVQTQLFIQLFEKGLIGKQDGRKVLRVLNLGTAEHELRSDIIDDEKAIRENQSFIDGTYKRTRQEGGLNFSIHDDHELHLERHTNLEKSEEANSWEDQRLSDLQQHELMHYTALQQVKLSQQISTETMKGAPAPETSVGSPGKAAPSEEVIGGEPEAGGGEMVAPGEAPAIG